MSGRLLIIGASGFLGSALQRSRDPRFEFIALDRFACDITSPTSVASAFAAARPAVAILLAALADIDRCEKEPALAHAINVEGARNVAQVCASSGAHLLFTSSGAIFDGEAESYRESDPPNPISVYGKSKAEAERVIRETLPSPAIVRLSLVLGASPHGGTNALLDKLQAAFSKGTPVFAPSDESRNAIDAETLVQWLLDLAYAPEASGIFHLGSSDAISRYDMTLQLAEAMGYSRDLVVSSQPHLIPDITPSRKGGDSDHGQSPSPPNRAPRGRRHMLIPEKIKKYSRVPIPTSLETIKRCIK
jgi:dTDP-4-dehydrorhamnose reductase